MDGKEKSRACGANPRKAALGVLMRCSGMTETGDGYSNLLTDAAIRRGGLGEQDRALMTRLVFGVIERRITLDYVISKLSSRPLSKLDADVLNILRLGLYQLMYADRVPGHAAVNETVSLAKQSSRGFVNAILRNYLRQKDAIAFPDPAKAPVKYLSVTYSVSEEICAEYVRIFGREKAESILSGCSREPLMTLRTNTLKNTREELRARLEDEGFECGYTRFSPTGIRLKNKSGLPKAVLEGYAFVQDEASQICGAALDAKPGSRVIDVCACPGSKSFSAAMQMKNSGSVLSCDLHGSKLPLIESGAKALGISIISTRERDASVRTPDCDGLYDYVICDVPCSGFGVMAKKPEIRYKSLDEAKKLPELQQKILESSSFLVKKGGTLVYSTCTVLPEENELNVKRFLDNNGCFEPEGFSCGELDVPSGMITLTPDGGTDGFFIAKLKRIK